jgi:hypothetical protein
MAHRAVHGSRQIDHRNRLTVCRSREPIKNWERQIYDGLFLLVVQFFFMLRDRR